MSNLTRIKNNQITDSTILANTKIVPGSIVGSLFNTNLTMTSDVTITGNLTVQGSSTYLTVASTNTYVNDPLIILNNAFSGTNTYDIGLLFNRGNQTTTALIWNEANDEFRLIYTTDDGTGYGAINNSGYGNIRVGNIALVYDASMRNIIASGTVDVTGNVNASGMELTGDLAVNGADLTTSASTFNLLASPTTLNVGAAATSLVLGATSGTLNLRNANIYLPNATTLYSGQSTVALLNENVTTLDIGGAATTLTVGATSGTLSLRNANVWLPNATTLDGAQSTVGLFNLATTVDAFKAATDIEFGATTGTLTINNPTVVGTQSTQNLYNTTATTLNFAGAATTLTIAAASGTTQIRNNLDVDLSLNARDLQSTVIGNVTPAAATFTALTSQGTTQLGLTSATAINNTPIGNATPAAATFTELTTNSTTNLSLTTATAINNTPIGNATPSTGSFTTLISSGITEVTDATDSTGAGTGAFRVTGGASVGGNLYVSGNINITGSSFVLTGNSGVFYGDVSGFGALYAGVTGYTPLPSTVLQTSATFNGYAQNNFENLSTGAQASTDWVATAGDGSDVDHYIDMGIVTANWDGTQDNSLTNAVGANDGYMYVQGNITTGQGGNLTIGASTPGTKEVRIIVGGNTAANVSSVFRNPNTQSTTTTTGALTVKGGVGITQNLNVGGNNTVDGNVIINADAQSTTSGDGALTVSGGVGIAKNLNVGGDVVVTGNLTVNGDVTTVNTATLDVEDLNITVAKGAGSAAAANGAGLTVDGAGATLLYADSDDSWNVNKLFNGTAASFSTTLAVTSDTTLTGDLAVNGGDLTTTATTFNLIDATATTVNFAGAATTIDLGATTGTLTINNPTVVGTQAIQNLYNTTATTVNFAGDATTLTVGATSGTTNVRNNLDVDLTLNARDINDTVIGNVTPAAATFTNVTDQSLTATRVTFAGTGGDLTDSADFTFATNILTVKNFSINGDTAEISVIGGSGNVVLNPDAGGVIDATASLISNVANPVSGQDVVTLSYLNTELSSNVSVISENNTDVTITDAGTGVITANVDATSVLTITSSSASFYSGFVVVDNATTNVAITGTAYISSTATVNGNLNVNSITTLNDLVSVTDATASTDYTNGALTVAGGVGVAGNLSLKLGQQITVGIEDPSANISFPERQMVLIANANVASGINVRNLSSASAATSNYIAVADNNVGESNFTAFGIASSGFDGTGGIVKANDAFIRTEGGNLALASGSVGNVFISTGLAESDLIARFSSSYANAAILKTTAATSATTGAFTVTGGVGLGSNLWVANGAVINSSQSSENFTVLGKNTTTLIHADSNYNIVTIGGSNTTPVSGATLRVNATDSMLVPTGATADRPSNTGNVDVAGMVRFNTSTTSLEFYTGSIWAAAGSDTTFTIISNEQYNGDGANVVYNLSANTTTNGTLVSVNGIVQIPTLAYSISGNVLTFTEAPALGDIIDIRLFALTQAVGDVTSGNGLNTFTPDDVLGAAIYSGTSTETKRLRVTAEVTGEWAYKNGTKTTYDQNAASITTTISVIDTFPAASYTSAKYIVQTINGSDVESMEALLVATSTDAYITTYGVVASNVALGTLTANVVSGNVRLYYNTALTNSNVKVYTTYIV